MVSGNEAAVCAEPVDGQDAVVVAALAPGHGGGVLQADDVRKGQHGGHRLFLRVLLPFLGAALPGDQCRAEGAHDAGDVRTYRRAAGDLFKGPEHRVVVKGPSLGHHMAAQIPRLGDLDDFEQGVFDDGIGQACGDVRHRGPFLLGLLDVGVHEDRAALAKVRGIFCKQSLPCKILHGIVQGFCKGFNKGAAAGGAGLVQLNGVHGAVFDADTFHVLSADVQDAVHLRIKKGGGIVMGDGLHLPLVQHKGRL